MTAITEALVDRITDHIERNLDDPGLSPARVAAAHHISTRYLHKLFEPLEQTVAARIRARRLERCRRDLGDPRASGRTVQDIAIRWGFSGNEQFSRCFRAAYGITPTEYRRVAAAGRRRY